MVSPFVVFVILATVMQNTFAFISPTYFEASDHMIGGYSILYNIEEVAHVQSQKMLNLFFSCLKDSSKGAFGGETQTINCQDEPKTFRNELQAASVTEYLSTMLVISIINPEDWTKLRSSWTLLGSPDVERFVNSIGDAITLVLDTDAYGYQGKIESLESRIISDTASMNDNIFSKFSYGDNTPLEMQTALRSAQRQVSEQLKKTTRAMFVGMTAVRTAIVSGNKTNTTLIFEQLQSAHKQASYAKSAETRVKFAAFKNIYLGLSVMHNGLIANFATMQAINTVSRSNYEKAMSSRPTIMPDGSFRLTIRNENGSLTEYIGHESCY